ncbi:MAG: CpsD/CapB family tyrosine-protein kinase [Syntrophales bacterium]|nr:CpsD/CapB family tyrosine-protein kinase [Syntrophales bacterium]MDD5232394.1 CpsD/CapB family tyrosine-protein kinase [Syntrophales bacterium]MDD5532821.1 CpsD/CapB family tyrosine-protein kinase [Syntrophales bacterium]
MSKIYEALEQAQKQKSMDQQPESVAPKREMPGVEGEMDCLYQTLESILPGTAGKTVQFIGSRAGEGTSTLARLFAVTVAGRMSRSVLLVDEDRKNPGQHRYFKIGAENGLEESFRDGVPVESAIYATPEKNLSLAVISKNPAAAARNLDLLLYEKLWMELKQRFDYVLVDSPPAGGSPGSVMLSRFMDGTVLVVEADRTRWPVAENTKEKILRSQGKVLGMVLNKRKYHIPEFIYRRI